MLCSTCLVVFWDFKAGDGSQPIWNVSFHRWVSPKNSKPFPWTTFHQEAKKSSQKFPFIANPVHTNLDPTPHLVAVTTKMIHYFWVPGSKSKPCHWHPWWGVDPYRWWLWCIKTCSWEKHVKATYQLVSPISSIVVSSSCFISFLVFRCCSSSWRLFPQLELQKLVPAQVVHLVD